MKNFLIAGGFSMIFLIIGLAILRDKDDKSHIAAAAFLAMGFFFLIIGLLS